MKTGFSAAFRQFIAKLPIKGGREKWFSEEVGLDARYLRRWQSGTLPNEDNWPRVVEAVKKRWSNDGPVMAQLATIEKRLLAERQQQAVIGAKRSPRPHLDVIQDRKLRQDSGSSTSLQPVAQSATMQVAPQPEPRTAVFPSDTKVSIKARRDFSRPDTLILPAVSEIFLLGINLDVAMAALSTLLDRLQKRVRLRLLCADPEGTTLPAFSAFSKVSADKRRNTIAKNIDELCSRLSCLGGSVQWELRVVDAFFSIGVIALDLDTAHGTIIAQTYLYGTRANNAPTLTLDSITDAFWYAVHKESLEALWASGRTVKRIPRRKSTK